MTNENEGSTNGSDAAKSSLAVGESEPKDAIPSKPATEADLKAVKEQMSGFERSTLGWTRASFLVILATGIFIGLQWREMHTGGQDTHDLAIAAGKQADVAKSQLEELKKQVADTHALALETQQQVQALSESNRINRSALQSVQRAFITFSPKGEIGTTVKDGKVVSWSPRVPMTNNGSTPAINVHDRGNFYVSREALPDDFKFPDTGKPETGTLGPKESMTYELDPIPIEYIQSLQVGWHLYVYGWATYHDTFPRTPEHMTKFCYEVRLSSLKGDVTDPNYDKIGRNVLCPLHNCTDEECKTEKPN